MVLMRFHPYSLKMLNVLNGRLPTLTAAARGLNAQSPAQEA